MNETTRPSAFAQAGIEPALEIVRVTKAYSPEAKALDDVTICAKKGQFLTILGQSGSGKTTLLRIISGLEQPTKIAALRIGGRDALTEPPHKRSVATVFQHFALFPHLSVGENIEYGLKIRGVLRAERRRRSDEVLETVRLPGMRDRRIHQLSGGERQRVALARSVIVEPDILLLDEPISALDESLRAAMQLELAALQRRLGMTFVYITHSQEEALTMSDRIVLMRRGRVAQEGAPRDLFERPSSQFAAGFMGVENILVGEIVAVESATRVVITVKDQTFSGEWTGATRPRAGDRACLLLRAERVKLVASAAAHRLDGQATASVYKGKYIDNVIETSLGAVVVRGDRACTPGAAAVWWDDDDARIAPSSD